MNLNDLEKILIKEPSFRKKQAKQVLFKDLIDNWFEAVTLPLSLRNQLNKECPIKIKAKTSFSQNKKVVKALITLNDNLKIETVLMRHQNKRNTVCVSSQVGCSLNCSFCATGKMGFKRNLTSFEIIEQVLFFARYLKKMDEKITNIVFMGMGEPFLNYENVISAIKTLNDKEGFNLGSRHFSISTVGIKEGIESLAQEKLQVNLAISLNAPDNKLRSKLMPINKKYPLEDIFEVVENYIKKTNRKVMFGYVMIKGVNDSDQCAQKLAKLMKKPLFFLNLIPYNPTGDFQPSNPQRIKKFKDILEKAGITVTQRYRLGRDIDAACGQLAIKDA